MKQAILLLCFTAIIISAQVKKEKYVLCELKKGTEVENNINLKEKYFVKVNGGDFWKEIIIRAQDSVAGIDKYRLYTINESGFSMGELSFNKIDENLYLAVENFKTKNGDEVSQLQITLDVEKKLIKYRWDNADDYEIPKIVKEYPFKKEKPFPAISVETVKGMWHSDKKNNVIVINWWNTDCPHCKEEMPALNKMVAKYKGKDVEFLSIVSDKKNLPRFLKKNKFNYLHGYGNEQIVKMFGNAFPRNIIINREGVIQYNEVGTDTNILKELDKTIESNL